MEETHELGASEVIAVKASPEERRDWLEEAPAAEQTLQATADPDGIARLELRDLEPGAAYSYAVDDEDEADATFRTFAEGPQDVTIVVGSCARVGSNAGVFG